MVALESVLAPIPGLVYGRHWERYTCIRMISAPASASAIAAAWPIPRVPPVIKAVCPSRENIAAVAAAIFCD